MFESIDSGTLDLCTSILKISDIFIISMVVVRICLSSFFNVVSRSSSTSSDRFHPSVPSGNGGKSDSGAGITSVMKSAAFGTASIDGGTGQGGESGPPQAMALEEKYKPIKSINKAG